MTNLTSYTAIMRGAVLHKLGLDFVKNRMIRVSYGTENRVPFQEGRHLASRRVLDYDGLPRCKGGSPKRSHIYFTVAKVSG
jgi:hypothetical protein